MKATGFKPVGRVTILPSDPKVTWVTPAGALSAGQTNSAYTISLSAICGNAGLPVTYSVVSGTLPTGVSLSNLTGGFSGTPSAHGTFNFTVRASAGRGFADQAFSVVVSLSTVVTWATAATIPTIYKGFAYSAPVVATVNDGTPITYAVISGGLPTGLTMASNGTISGTPTLVTSFNFTVRATAGLATADRTFTLAVADSVVSWVSPAAGVLTGINGGSTFPTTFSATTTATGHAVSYSIVSGAAPQGTTFNGTTGTFSGTVVDDTATYGFTIRATDGVVYTDRAFSISVAGTGPSWGTATLASTTFDSGALANTQYFGLYEGAQPSQNGQWMAVTQFNNASRKILIFARNGDAWTFHNLLNPSFNPTEQVRISNDGMMLAIADTAYSTQMGRIVVYRRANTSSATVFTQSTTLDNPAGNNAGFATGPGFDMNGDGTVISAGTNTNFETAYAWRYNGSTYTRTNLISGENTSQYGGRYGSSGIAVSDDGNYIVVAARRMYRTGGDNASNAGKIYVHRWTGSAWAAAVAINNPDASIGTFATMGTDVSINSDGSYIAVANPAGKLRFFSRSGTTWSFAGAADPAVTITGDDNYTRCDMFGGTAVSANRNHSSNTGSVVIYKKPTSGTTWTQVRKLDGAQASENFGTNARFAGDEKTLVVTSITSTQGAVAVGKAFTYKA